MFKGTFTQNTKNDPVHMDLRIWLKTLYYACEAGQ